VQRLFGSCPFSGEAPQQIRVLLAEYTLTPWRSPVPYQTTIVGEAFPSRSVSDVFLLDYLESNLMRLHDYYWWNVCEFSKKREMDKKISFLSDQGNTEIRQFFNQWNSFSEGKEFMLAHSSSNVVSGQCDLWSFSRLVLFFDILKSLVYHCQNLKTSFLTQDEIVAIIHSIAQQDYAYDETMYEKIKTTKLGQDDLMIIGHLLLFVYWPYFKRTFSIAGALLPYFNSFAWIPQKHDLMYKVNSYLRDQFVGAPDLKT